MKKRQKVLQALKLLSVMANKNASADEKRLARAEWYSSQTPKGEAMESVKLTPEQLEQARALGDGDAAKGVRFALKEVTRLYTNKWGI